MSIFNSIYGAVIEVALWMFASQALAMLAAPTAIAGYVALIVWRFGLSGLKSVFGFRRALSLPSMALMASAIIQYETSFVSLTSQAGKALLIPLQEELLYRFILPRTVKKYFPRALGVIVSALMFCAAHRRNSFSISDSAVCLLAGLALGFRAERRDGSIMEPFLMHALHNVHVLNGVSHPGLIGSGVKYLIGPVPFYTAILGYDIFLLLH